MHLTITGSSGFIGNALCKDLSKNYSVLGLDQQKAVFDNRNIIQVKVDISDLSDLSKVFIKHSTNTIIHCAGLAHQKIGSVGSDDYMRVNSEATENIAKAATKSNNNVDFIFLSSISVYGENPQIEGVKSSAQQIDFKINEDGKCNPSSDYARSKLDAEKRLIALFNKGLIRRLSILRLAPVYDFNWSLNLDRRVFMPGKWAYCRYGSGSQKISALARPNLIDFINHLLARPYHDKSTKKAVNNENRQIELYNVCDLEAYAFSRIINVFNKSNRWPNRPSVNVPLFPVWFATRALGAILSNKRAWLHSCYDKLTYDLVFDNERMLNTGFRPKHSLETIFLG